MATRMQQRRGTAAQWTAANPTLAAGEIGFETDNNRFKIGDGATAWSALDYFANNSALEDLLDGAPNALNTLNELAAAINDDPAFFTTIGNVVDNHISDTTLIHGIEDTAQLATKSYADQAVSTHSTDTTNVHGIADTSVLVTTTNLSESISTAVSTHGSDTTSVHGIADTAELATKTYADDAVAAEALVTAANLTDHNTETINVHGIADTAALATQDFVTDAIGNVTGDYSALAGSGLDWNPSTEAFDVDPNFATKTYADDAVSTHNDDTTNVHGIADTAALATKSYADTAEADAITAAGTAADTKIATAVAALTKSSVGLANVDNTSDANKPVSTATQTALDAKASLAGATFTGNVEVDGNLVVDGDFTVNGTNFSASATSITIEDNMVQLAHQNAANTVDLGIVVGYNDGAAKHSGIVRDVSADKWKLFKGVTSEPSTTVDFTQGSLDALQVGALEATTVTPSSGIVFSDGTQTKEGVQSRTPIIQKTASYTLSALTERDSMIEMGSASAITLTVPTNATVAWPVGTSIDILQTGAGQVTIAPAAGVTINGTPGLKLRTQWSGVTLFKRAENTWVVYGDLTA
jgi:hypothetical protein